MRITSLFLAAGLTASSLIAAQPAKANPLNIVNASNTGQMIGASNRALETVREGLYEFKKPKEIVLWAPKGYAPAQPQTVAWEYPVVSTDKVCPQRIFLVKSLQNKFQHVILRNVEENEPVYTIKVLQADASLSKWHDAKTEQLFKTCTGLSPQ